MTVKLRRQALAAALLALAAAACHAQQRRMGSPASKDSITVRPDVENGVAHVEYWEDGEKKTASIPMRNQTRVSITASVTFVDGAFRYSYSLANAREAKEPLCSVSLILPDPALATAVSSAPGWQHGAIPSSIEAATSAVKGARRATFFDWYPGVSLSDCVAPGKALGGFELTGSRLPGIATVYAKSEDRASPVLSAIPGEAIDAVVPYLSDDKASQRLYTVAPMIDPESPISSRIATFKFGLTRVSALAADPEAAAFARKTLGLLAALPATTSEPNAAAMQNLCHLASEPARSPVARDAATAIRFSLCGARE